VVSLGALLAGSEPSLTPGGEAVVSVAVSTLWAAPDRVRPIDEPALLVPSRPRDWMEGMSADDRADLRGRAVSQLLLGEHVRVVGVHDFWTHVIALGHADSTDPDGLPGWLPTDQLSTLEGVHAAGIRVAARHRESDEAEDRTGVWHVVTATATALRDDPDAALAVPGVTFGTRLMALGAPHDGWVPVAVPGRFEPAWAIEDDLDAIPPTPPSDPAVVLEWADRLRDAPFVWGGSCAFGVDGPGLVHLTWRRFGVTLPRDAKGQAQVTTPVPLGQERPGDLYFFAGPSGDVEHVGFVAGGAIGQSRQVLHADEGHGSVVWEELTGQRANTLVAAHRVA
jgi:cell wall-associated NlpC family hydrolase